MAATTIKDVARIAGVSIATVSYVINNGPRPVSVETRRRVLEAMTSLGFEPNVSARRLRLQHNNVLGLAVAGLSGQPGFSDLYFLDFLRGISVAADHAGYDLVLFSNYRKLQTEEFFQSLARQHIVDGLIASGSAVSGAGLEHVQRAGQPVVVVGRHQPVQGLYTFEFSYQEDAAQVTRLLAHRGHRRIGLLLNSSLFASEHLRLAGYRQALAELGLTYAAELVYLPGEMEAHPPQDAVRRIVGAGATALVCGPHRDVCAYLAAEGAAGVEVGTLDYDEIVPRQNSLVVVTHQAKYEAGVRAVELLVRVLSDPADLPKTTVLSSVVEE